MKKRLLTFGLLALFTAVSYVPPSAAALKAARAGEAPVLAIVEEVPLPGDREMPSATQIIGTLRSARSSTLEFIGEVPSLMNRRVVGSAEEHTRAFVDKIGSAARQKLGQFEQLQRATSMKQALSFEPDETIRSHFKFVEWAIQKADARACTQIGPTVLAQRSIGTESLATPSYGDFLAYCIARVTRNRSRCGQIASETSPPLKRMCEQELTDLT